MGLLPLYLARKVLFFFSEVLGLELRTYTLNHSTSLFCVCDGFLEIGSHRLFALAWLQAAIILISAS
jgi:hypothetical protein